MTTLMPSNPRGIRRLLIVVAALTGALLEVLDTTITSVAVPQMMGNLGATLAEIGWVTTGYIISNVIILPLTGWLADQFGRKRFFAVSIVVFTVASLMCALSGSLWALVFWRIIQGLGGGALMATGQVIMLDAFPVEKRGIATAIFGMGVMIGPLLGPVLGGYLTDNYSWPAIFAVNIPFGILAAILTVLYVPNADYDHDTQQTPIDYIGILLLAVGMGALQTVLERGQSEDWFSSRLIVALSVTSVVGLVGFIAWELRTKYPVLDIRLFRVRSLSSGALFGAAVGLGLYGMQFLLPVYLQNIRSFSAYQTGIIQLAPAVLSTLSFMIAGPLTQTFGGRRMLFVGTILMAAGSALLANLTSQSSVDDLMPALHLRAFSLGFLFIPLTTASLADLTPRQLGAGSGIINLTRQLGGSIGIAMLATLVDHRSTFHRDRLADHIATSSQTAGTWTANVQAALMHGGMDTADAHTAAIGKLAAVIGREAAVMSFNDMYIVITLAFVIAAPLIYGLSKRTATGPMEGVH
ncbi:MAG TPA: DHA2 family efflux MFS transporter permease subunit [Capsulimonadaceae bacterium]|jgi:DHA2 family multidrug resistance protein